MKKIGVMIDDGFHDLEFRIPYYRFKEEGINFDILAFENRDYKGVYGIDSVKPTQLLSHIETKYDLIYIPGAKSPNNLLKNPETVAIIKDMSAKGSSFATICHGPLLLAEAGLLYSKEITGHPSIKEEIELKGAKYVDLPYVRSSKNILSGKTHLHIDQMMRGILRFLEE